jgi:hypothetical protein
VKTYVKAVLAALFVGGLAFAWVNQANSAKNKWQEQRIEYAKGKFARAMIPSDFTKKPQKKADGAEYTNPAGDNLMLGFVADDTGGQAAEMLKTIRSLKGSKSMKIGPYTIDEKVGDLLPHSPNGPPRLDFAVIIPTAKKGMRCFIVLFTKKTWNEVRPEFEYIAKWIALHNNP